MADASDFKFGTQLEFAKAHHKITPKGKRRRGLGLGKLPYIWGFPLIFLQRPRCPLSVSVASCYLYYRPKVLINNCIYIINNVLIRKKL